MRRKAAEKKNNNNKAHAMYSRIELAFVLELCWGVSCKVERCKMVFKMYTTPSSMAKMNSKMLIIIDRHCHHCICNISATTLTYLSSATAYFAI